MSQLQLQSFSLATATNLGSEWTSAELRTLQVYKAGNMPIKEIARLLGRSYYSVSTKIKELGLSNRQSNTPVTPTVTCPNCFVAFSNTGACMCI